MATGQPPRGGPPVVSHLRTGNLDRELLHQHRLLNLAQTVLLVGGMAGVLWLSARFLLGEATGWYLATVAVLALWMVPRLSPRLVLRLYQARPIEARAAPQLHAVLHELAQRAELPQPPALFYIPSRLLNAFAVGGREDSAIGLTDGMLQSLDLRELAGVLAHEVTHIRNGDLRVMAVADLISRLTEVLSLTGQVMLLLGLPLWLLGVWELPLVGVALLIFAPTLTALLQLALSRTREFDADLGAARLTGDPRGLASALAKLERQQGGWMEQILMPGRRNPHPSVLRSHPETSERVRRLMSLVPAPARSLRLQERRVAMPHFGPSVADPRRRRWGVWY